MCLTGQLGHAALLRLIGWSERGRAGWSYSTTGWHSHPRGPFKDGREGTPVRHCNITTRIRPWRADNLIMEIFQVHVPVMSEPSAGLPLDTSTRVGSVTWIGARETPRSDSAKAKQPWSVLGCCWRGRRSTRLSGTTMTAPLSAGTLMDRGDRGASRCPMPPTTTRTAGGGYIPTGSCTWTWSVPRAH